MFMLPCPKCHTVHLFGMHPSERYLTGPRCKTKVGIEYIDGQYRFARDFVDPQTGEVVAQAGHTWTQELDDRLRVLAVEILLHEHEIGSSAWPTVVAIHDACVQGALTDWRGKHNQ